MNKTQITKSYIQIQSEMKKHRSKKHFSKQDIQDILLAKETGNWEVVHQSTFYLKHSNEYCSLLEVLNNVKAVS
ncbi:hypothetical protein BK126_26150 [Paenibacillus sp. FSL H7-0326]|uniref:hypothetical protein n=1 Tax=Paenibacillus sp. FSL H7-0326 TaxID=1921144 RepID=UPI00096CF12B|nr:hypothetical protein [Paenibacillus sp. FSL H7-0326]OMC63679.1 hypothetical protein BK126_26150 [Paenibacillus sp. FSL H7-0326]